MALYVVAVKITLIGSVSKMRKIGKLHISYSSFCVSWNFGSLKIICLCHGYRYQNCFGCTLPALWPFCPLWTALMWTYIPIQILFYLKWFFTWITFVVFLFFMNCRCENWQSHFGNDSKQCVTVKVVVVV